MSLLKVTVLLFLITIMAPTLASAKCYSKAEAEADQGIRIHSELMVIGLNCQAIGARHGLNLYSDYRNFTEEHADLFAQYEKILMSFYKRNGQTPKKKLNNLRTNYANKISKVAASGRPDVFCARNAVRIEKAGQMERVGLRRWASTLYPTHPVSYPLCNQ